MYLRESDDTISEQVKVEFLEKVAVMAAFPYLRADVQSLSAALRLGDITLGILRLGEFKVNIESEPRPDEEKPAKT